MSKVITLHSSLPPGAAAEALRRSMDDETLTLFSRSGFNGSLPVIGEVIGDSFRLKKRISYRNDLARQFYGRFEPEEGRTKIEGHFAMGLFPRIFMTIWLLFVIIVGGIAFFITARDLQAGRASPGNNQWLGLAAPAGLLLAGLGILWFCRKLSARGERFILEHLKSTLSATNETPTSDPVSK